MTHHEADRTTITCALELPTGHGFRGKPEALALLLNHAMKTERLEHLNVAPYKGSDFRRGHSNGFKPRTVVSRLSKLGLSIPQVREAADGAECFYPMALERGEPSESAL